MIGRREFIAGLGSAAAWPLRQTCVTGSASTASAPARTATEPYSATEVDGWQQLSRVSQNRQPPEQREGGKWGKNSRISYPGLNHTVVHGTNASRRIASWRSISVAST
jgi:hypothetical protein